VDPPQQTTRRDFLRTVQTGILAAPFVPALASASPSDSENSGEWKIGCFTRPWAEYDYRVALDAIADAGFAHVGLMTAKTKNGLVISLESTIEEVLQVRAEVSQRDLNTPCVYAGNFPLTTIENAIVGLHKLVDYCAVVGSATLLLAGAGNPNLQARYYKAIAESADYAAEQRVAIALKPHGGETSTGMQCRQRIQVVGHKNCRLWYDPGNIYYYSDGKLNPVAEVAALDGMVTGVCVKDYMPPKNVMVTPGDGLVDFPALIERLIRGGFTRGPLLIETLTPGDRPALLKEAKRARRFIEHSV